MSYLSMGTVYGTLLNFRSEQAMWASRMQEAPYKGAPKAPVLYIKPSNTWSQDGAAIVLPASVDQVEVGATIAMVMRAPGDVAGYVLMNDLSIAHDNYYRPPVRYKCLDGFLGVGGTILEAAQQIDPSSFSLEVRVNDKLCQTVDFSGLARNATQLLADVSEFMTLGAGDVLMLGCDVLPDGTRPLATRGDKIELRAQGMGTLTNYLIGALAQGEAA